MVYVMSCQPIMEQMESITRVRTTGEDRAKFDRGLSVLLIAVRASSYMYELWRFELDI